MANTAYSVSQTEIGLAVETVRGTAVAPAFWIPAKSPKYEPKLTLIADDTLQGSMVETYDEVPGMRYDSHGWEGYPYLDSFPLFLRAELGSSDTLTAAGAATTLSAAAIAGAATITTATALTEGSYVVIGAGGTLETRLVASVATDTATLAFPLIYAHASGQAVTPLTTHQFSLLNNAGSGNQPPSVTVTDYDGSQWRQLTAAQLDELNVKGNTTGLADYTCTWFANASTTPTAPTPSYSSARAVPGWTTSVAIGGTPVNYVEDWEVDMKRGVEPIPALTGSQEYYLYFANALTATAKLTIIEQANSPQLTEFENGTKQSLDITIFDIGTGNALNLHSSSAVYTSGTVDRGSKGEVKIALDAELLPSAADALAGGVSPLLATVANAQTAPY
ncbi:MAG TPA: phage tail tube protein [Mycobacteriales bacterium]